MNTERHPFEPFLPPGARILMAGSFPPPQARWDMDWYYPNLQNDMWRIMGVIAADDRNYFLTPDLKHFDRPKIETWCHEVGLALSDTGLEVVRLKNNASDKFLEVVTPRDFAQLLSQMPRCRSIVLTGEKAVATLGEAVGFKEIPVGEYVTADYFPGRTVKIWRMPSSSRAFPRSIEWKADYYRRVFVDLGIKV